MQREKSAQFCKAHLGFHSHQTVGWGVSTFGRQRWVSFALPNSHLMNCEMGRSFLGLVSQPCPMGKEQELEERSPQVSTKAQFTPASFYTVHFASQSSSQSVTKYRGITDSRNGSLSPFCVKMLLQRWHEGLKSPESSVLSTSRGSRGICCDAGSQKKSPGPHFGVRGQRGLMVPHANHLPHWILPGFLQGSPHVPHRVEDHWGTMWETLQVN